MLRFSFSVGNTGWLDLEAQFDGETFYASYGWCTNFPDELLQGVLNLFEPENGGEACCKGDREGTVDVWRLRLEGEALTVEIDSFAQVDLLSVRPYPAEKRTEYHYFSCETEAFLHALLQGYASLLRRNGFDGYRRNWGAAFPAGLFLRLAHLCGEGPELGVEAVPLEESRGAEAVRSDVWKELDFLKKAAGGGLDDTDSI